MARKPSLKKQLEALADTLIPDVRKAFMASIRDVSETAMLGAIIEAIREGDLEKAFRATGLSPAAMRPVSAMIETAFEKGGVTVSNALPNINSASGPTIFRFDVRNSRAEAWLRDQSSGLVTRITEQTRTNIQTIVQAGMRDGRNPRNVALDIIGRVDPTTGRRTGGIVGLTDQQAKWVANARRELSGVPDAAYFSRVQRDRRFDKIVQRAINDGKPLDAGKVDALIGKYSDNLLQLRGETIARTEMLQALAKSQDEAIRQAIDTGAVKPQNITKKWDATGDKRTRESHAAMDGQSVKMDEAFTTPDGHKLLIPGDSSLGAPASEIINCRCRVDYDIDFLAGLENEFTPVPPPAPPAPAPVPRTETAVRNARLNKEQRNYVLNEGRANGVEFLSNIDMETGEIFGRNVGTKGNVQFPPDLISAIRDPKRKISLHHNHPSSSSFSPQDLFMLREHPGMKEIWAHGHNGSSFYASKGESPLELRNVFPKIEKEVHDGIDKFLSEKGIRIDQDVANDLNLIFYHIVSLLIEQRGFIVYRAELVGPSLKALNRNREMIERILK